MTWIIFGMVCLYTINNLIQLLNELVLVGGIIIDVTPNLLGYLKLFSYGIIAMVLVFVSIRILRQDRIEEYSPNFKKLRKYYLIILGIGIISTVSFDFLIKYRIDILGEYLKQHSMGYTDIFEMITAYSSMVGVVLFIYFSVIFFVLTKKIERMKVAAKSKAHLANGIENEVNNQK